MRRQRTNSPAVPPRADPGGHGLRGPWRVAATAAWLAVAVPALVLAVIGFVAAYERPDLVGPQVVERVLTQAGIPLHWTLMGLLLPILVLSVGTGLVIFWRRTNDWMALLISLTLVTFGATFSRSLHALEAGQPSLRPAALFIENVAIVAMALAIYLFPDGRFVPRWTRWAAAAAPVAVLLLPGAPDVLMALPAVPDGMVAWQWWATIVVGIGIFGLEIGCQIYRYSRVSGWLERQQMKWVTFSLVLVLGGGVLGLGVPSLFWEPGVWFGWGVLTLAFPSALFPISIALAVLRYRLYDIDVVIRRALIYGALTGALALASWLAVILLQQLLRPLTQGSELAIGLRASHRGQHSDGVRAVPASPPAHSECGGPTLLSPQVRHSTDAGTVQRATTAGSRAGPSRR